MAITVCSTSTPSPTISTLRLKSSNHLNQPAKLSFGLSSDEAKDLHVLRQKLCELEKENELERDWENGCLVRRRKRRKRRKQGLESCSSECFGEYEDFSSRNSGLKSGEFLTVEEQAVCSFYIKEEARLESFRRILMEEIEHEPTLNQWAKAVGMKESDIDKILCRGRASRERVNQSFRKLVASMASRYLGKGLSLQDLIQEGSIGLIRGVKKFDPERGNKLSTYIYWWIRHALTNAIAKKSRTIRLPGNMCDKLPKIAEANKILTKRLLRRPSYDELAEAVEMDEAKVRLICQRTRAPISLDLAVTSEGSFSPQEFTPGPEEMTPEAMVKKQEMKKNLEKLLSVLSDRECHILRLRYGLGVKNRSYEDIGRELSLSRERVRQINDVALSKLRRSNMLESMKVYIT